MNSKVKGVKPVPGDVFEIKMVSGRFAYGYYLLHGSTAFFDIFSNTKLPMEEVVENRIRFTISVRDYIIKKGIWKKIGHVPHYEKRFPTPRYFIQDALHKERFEIYFAGKITPARMRDCIGLERMASWDLEHVLERLEAESEGRRSKWITPIEEDKVGWFQKALNWF